MTARFTNENSLILQVIQVDCATMGTDGFTLLC